MRAQYLSVGRTRRHPVLRIVIIAVLLLAIAEPLVMYRSLMRERDQRQQALAQTLQSESDMPASGDAAR